MNLQGLYTESTFLLKKEKFLAFLPEITKKLPQPSVVPLKTFETLKKTHAGALKEIDDLKSRIEKQTITIGKLSELKDKAQVAAIKTSTAGDSEKFEVLIGEVRDALDSIGDTIVKDVLFAHLQKQEYHWPGFGMDSERDALKVAIDNGYLFDGDDYIGVNIGDPAVEHALKALKALDVFLAEESFPEFHTNYKKEYGMEADIHNKRFWKVHFK